MRWSELLEARGWWKPIALWSASLPILVLVGPLRLPIPGIDEPRRLVHAVLAFMPVVLAGLVLDPHPDLSPGLRRERIMALMGCTLFWMMLGLGAVLCFAISPMPRYEAAYLCVGTLGVAALSLLVTRRLGSVGVLLASVLALVWLYLAYPFPQLLGFDELGFGGRPEPVPVVPVLLAVLAAGIASVLTVLRTGSRSTR